MSTSTASTAATTARPSTTPSRRPSTRQWLYADFVIGLGHLGVDGSSSPYTSREVIQHTVGFNAFIDGHSHTEMPGETVRDAEGNPVVLTQTGCYLGNVGRMTIDTDRNFTTELISSSNVNPFNETLILQTDWINAVDDMLGEKIAESPINFYINDPVTGNRLIRSEETNMGDLVADGIYAYFNEIEQLDCDIAIMNGGGIRADIPAGDWTYMSCKTVSPFGNVACLMSVTGAQIQNALEFGARYAGSGQENGGFLQVAGATYEIHTDIPNTVQTDDQGVWSGPATGTPRVQNVKIYNKATGAYEPLDPNRTYNMAGMNYTLRSLGDGFAMFDGAALGQGLRFRGLPGPVQLRHAVRRRGHDHRQQPPGRLPRLPAGLREPLRRRPHHHRLM